ncbi:MAG: hypothetical protein U9O95_07835 [Candidatus Marinimicrobia bacterium]|nr:hypothetical protein [Candidatus Neomarinimicrobiota bacterium]
MKKTRSTYFSSILRRFRGQKAKDRLKHLALEFLASNSLYLLICLLLESIWYLSPNEKTILWYGLFLNAFFLFRAIDIVLRLLVPNEKTEDESLLLTIGQQFPKINDKLLNHYQLSTKNNPISSYAVESFIQQFPVNYFRNSYQNKPIKTKRKFAVIIFSALLIFSILLASAFSRFLHIQKAFEPLSEFSIDLSPNNISLYSYDSLSINIRKNAPPNFPIEIYVDDSTKNMPVLFLRSRDSVLNYSLGRLQRSAVYYARLRRPHLFHPRKYIDTDTLNVILLQRPRIRSLDFTVRSPEYSGISDAFYQGNVDRLTLLYGSEISIDIRLSEPFGPSTLIISEDTFDLKIDNDHAHITWIPQRTGSFKLKLINKAGISVESDPGYTIKIEEDAFPALEILNPKLSDDLLLNEELALPYVAHLKDDFGISSFTVNYTVHSEYSFSLDTSAKSIDLPFTSDSRLQTRMGVWEIKDFISPGSEIRYYFKLSDNDAISGFKTIRSTIYYATFPSLIDLFERQDEIQEKTIAMLEDELISTKEVVEELDEIQKQLLQEGEMSWEDKTALEENLNALEKAEEELKNMQSAMDEQKKFMEENALFSDDVMKSFEQLQELMNELIDDELFEMMRMLQEKLQRNDTSNMEEILKDFTEKAKRFEESLDRMLEVFKRIQQEQRLEELGQKIKESLKEQQNLLEKADQRSSDDLAEQQDKISNDTKKWEKLSENSSKLFDEEAREAYEEFLEKMNEEDVSFNMDMASESYQRSDRQNGKKQSRKSEQKLRSLEQSFSQMASSMMQKQKDEVANAFQRAFHQTLFMSNEQEKTLEEGRDLTNGSPLIHQYTSKTNNILQIALDINEDLLALSKKTFLVDKAIGRALGQVIGNLRSGIRQIEEAKLPTGQKNFNTAFKSMNQLALILLERLNMIQEQKQGNASGMEFYMQQLQQMAEQQQQLNSSMPQPGMNISPGSSMMDQLAKMAARQQALRRRLKQIQQEMSKDSGSNRMKGNLDRIARDMEDVINQMRKNQVDRQTIMRQEKIVQRLLDASRSATSRDYKKERESITAKEILRDNPLSLPGDLGDHESLINALRHEVQNSELSPKEKRDMERYLESLLGQKLGSEVKK